MPAQLLRRRRLPCIGRALFRLSLICGVDQRFKAAISNLGGIYRGKNPETDPYIYAPRVRTPTLVIGGKYDLEMPLETTVRPLYRALGTPDAHKSLVIVPSDHWVDRTELIRLTVSWLDRYLGPVIPVALDADQARFLR